MSFIERAALSGDLPAFKLALDAYPGDNPPPNDVTFLFLRAVFAPKSSMEMVNCLLFKKFPRPSTDAAFSTPLLQSLRDGSWESASNAMEQLDLSVASRLAKKERFANHDVYVAALMRALSDAAQLASELARSGQEPPGQGVEHFFQVGLAILKEACVNSWDRQRVIEDIHERLDAPNGALSAPLLCVAIPSAPAVRALLLAGANPNSAQRSTGQKALHFAVQAKSLACVNALLAAHARPDAADFSGNTPGSLAWLNRAASDDNPPQGPDPAREMMRALFNAGASPYSGGFDGLTWQARTALALDAQGFELVLSFSVNTVDPLAIRSLSDLMDKQNTASSQNDPTPAQAICLIDSIAPGQVPQPLLDQAKLALAATTLAPALSPDPLPIEPPPAPSRIKRRALASPPLDARAKPSNRVNPF